jgi:hypothetical protein
MNDLPLTAIFETILIGVLVVWVVDLTSRLFRGADRRNIPDEFLPDPRLMDLWVRRQPAIPTAGQPDVHGDPRWGAMIGFVAVCYVLGMFVSATADSFYTSPGTDQSPLGVVMGREGSIRTNVFFRRLGAGTSFAAQYRHLDGWEHLEAAAVACAPPDAHQLWLRPHYSSTCRHTAMAGYYVAKNAVYADAQYAREMQALDLAITTLRAFAMTSFFAVSLLLAGMVAGLRDVHGRTSYPRLAWSGAGLLLAVVGLLTWHGTHLLEGTASDVALRVLSWLVAPNLFTYVFVPGLAMAAVRGDSPNDALKYLRWKKVLLYGVVALLMLLVADVGVAALEEERVKRIFGYYLSLRHRTEVTAGTPLWPADSRFLVDAVRSGGYPHEVWRYMRAGHGLSVATDVGVGLTVAGVFAAAAHTRYVHRTAYDGATRQLVRELESRLRARRGPPDDVVVEAPSGSLVVKHARTDASLRIAVAADGPGEWRVRLTATRPEPMAGDHRRRCPTLSIACATGYEVDVGPALKSADWHTARRQVLDLVDAVLSELDALGHASWTPAAARKNQIEPS